ncbi:Peroxiredoxin-6 [Arthrobotrys conoides]|uniref:Peroxiredoxin-6 n=1 Tax=Arthrobotrys conoides TaxID=74498 RepID=A0AAN8NEY7_9PEZI
MLLPRTPLRRLRAIPTLLSTTSSRSYHPTHLYPGQKVHPNLIPLLNTISPSSTTTVRSNDIWKVLFTATGPRDPVSTTNLKSFSEVHTDLLERDTAVLVVVPGTDKATKSWLKDIAKSSKAFQDRPIDLEGEVSSRVLGFPVIADPNYTLLKRLGFLEGEKPHTLLHIIDPTHTIRLTQLLPPTLGINTLDIVRTLHALQTSDDYDILIPSDWIPGKDALMPINRLRTPAGIQALQRDMAETPNLPGSSGIDSDDGLLRDRDDEGELIYRSELEEEYENRVLDNSMPPGEVWEVLPYLRYVRIDDSVENSNSIIGYERMRGDLIRNFERFKFEKGEKKEEGRKKEAERTRSQREKAVMELLREAERGRLPRKK